MCWFLLIFCVYCCLKGFVEIEVIIVIFICGVFVVKVGRFEWVVCCEKNGCRFKYVIWIVWY